MTMKFAVCLLVGVVSIAPSQSLDENSRKMLESLDPGLLLSNKQFVDPILNCLFEVGPCDSLGAEVKKNVNNALLTGCSECPEEQVILLRKVLQAFVPRYPNEFQKFLDKYDPERKYWPTLKNKLQLNQ